MNSLKKIFFAICFVCFGTESALSGISPICATYTNCDDLVACELFLQVDNAMHNLSADYNSAIVNVALNVETCKNYPNLFKKNINVKVSNNPSVTVTIDWDIVRKRIIHGNITGVETDDIEFAEEIAYMFGPDTEQQKNFFQDLSLAYIIANNNDESIVLDDNFVWDFLSKDDNFEKYRLVIRDLTGISHIEDYGILIDWDNVLLEISAILDIEVKRHGALICENNRSIQLGADIVGWIATAVAAILTFYAGGAGGAGVAAARAGIGSALKALAKGATKIGLKTAGKKLSKAGSKQLTIAAVKLGLKKNMRGWANYAGKGVLKGALKGMGKNFTKKAGKNMATKIGLIASTSGMAIWQIGYGVGNSSPGGTLYSYLESSLDKEFLNCQDLDRNEGCYTICGTEHITGNDDLNKYVLTPTLGKKYCVDDTNYILYEVKSDGNKGATISFDDAQFEQIKQRITKNIQDKGNCNWNEDDIDMYFGFYIYDPDTLEISNEIIIIDDAIRIDE